VPVCLLTNFAEFAVYDTRYCLKQNDNASTARIFYCKYNELDKPNPHYPEVENNWDYLYRLFSQSGIRKGLSSHLIKSNKKGTQEVDDMFLCDMESWREKLALNITKENPNINERDLNFVVQKTIDRIIFLRICEDRGIEPHETLKSIASKDDVYPALLTYFLKAAPRYDSGLFHFRNEKYIEEAPDTISKKIIIGNKVLKDIIKSLYAPAPYNFSLFPAEILGSIYERFLGKVIYIDKNHKAKVEYKPEVKKAGGVYYTPEYIVSYIVKNTVGQQLNEKTLTGMKNFRILDPACGSGSFLINAYQYLLDWYKKQYSKEPDKYKKQCVKINNIDGIEYKLTIAERKRILTSHIYGVDIDRQAVEVTKLSLLLKALEGLNEHEIQEELFAERALPDLSKSIKCGNSLISNDFYLQTDLELTDDEKTKVNCFNWEDEFKDIFKAGGFDVVIGNPPYVNAKTLVELYKEERNYLSVSTKYNCLHQKWDLYIAFIEKSIQLLCNKGYLSMIIPYPFLNQNYGTLLRRDIAEHHKIIVVV
jgi:type I restriction-modification system DNA methylase subunit